MEFGAFVDLERYTRLITYSRLEDLRAVNQTFGRLPVDQDPADCLPPCPGFTVVDENDKPIPVRIPDDGVVERFKRPWVYMGPGNLPARRWRSDPHPAVAHGERHRRAGRLRGRDRSTSGAPGPLPAHRTTAAGAEAAGSCGWST